MMKIVTHFYITYKKGYREEQQKSSPDKSDELLNMLLRILEAINLTYLSRHVPSGWNWHLSPYNRGRLSRLHRAITLCLSW